MSRWSKQQPAQPEAGRLAASRVVPRRRKRSSGVRWRQRPTVITVGMALLSLIKRAKEEDAPVPFIPALEVDVMPGIMATTL